jgi:hypothetical protein
MLALCQQEPRPGASAYKHLVENKELTIVRPVAILADVNDAWTPPDAPKARVEREYAALFRIHQRHADSAARRARPGLTPTVGPSEAVRLLVSLAAGSAVVEDGEDDVDAADLTAALTLMPNVRAEVDRLEASLLIIARARGMTWQELAYWMGLGSAQAARQRYERLALRTAPDHAPADPQRGPDKDGQT